VNLARLEDGERPGEPHGRLGQAVEPQRDRAADCGRRDPVDVLRRPPGRVDALRPQCDRKLTEQERRPPCGAEERVLEGRAGSRSEHLLDERTDPRRGERLQADHLGQGIRADRAQQVGRGAALVLPGGDDERHGQLLEARQQKREEAQGGHVGPVGVVDDEADGPLGGKIGAQPVEPVQYGERPVGDVAGVVGNHRCTGQP
jgi:hypothetical protein